MEPMKNLTVSSGMRCAPSTVIAGLVLSCCGCAAGNTSTVGGCPQPTALAIGSTADVQLFMLPSRTPTAPTAELGADIGQARWFRKMPRTAARQLVGRGEASVVSASPSPALRVTTDKGAVTLQWVGYGCA